MFSLSTLPVYHSSFSLDNFDLKWYNVFMKKALLISLPTLLITGLIAIGGVSQAVSSLPEVPKPVVTIAPSPVEKPVVVEKVVVATPAPKPTQEALEPVVEATEATPSNEDLISQYGWATGSERESIDYIIWMFPKYFTESERETAFAYLNDAAESNAQVGDTERRVNSVNVVRWYFMQHFQDESWVNIGTISGIDTSYYQ